MYWKLCPDGDGRRADLPGGDLHVLLADGADDVVGGQVARLQPLRVEPDAHAVVLGAHHLDLADAGNAAEHVLDVEIDVVADVDLVVQPLAVASSRLTISTMFVDFFFVTTPWRLTSSGSLGSAMPTRFCTSTVAMSMSVPTSNVTVRSMLPSSELFDYM